LYCLFFIFKISIRYTFNNQSIVLVLKVNYNWNLNLLKSTIEYRITKEVWLIH
jgi:hypothetical protein